MRHLISIGDLTNAEIEEIFELADDAETLRRDKPERDRILATLFYEPSTRTRLSFESAMHRLGGGVISCADMRASSAAKGESLADTAKVVSSYADTLVVRHHWDGAVRAMAEHADVPVVNAGDGRHEHPTQTLCDLYTLRREKGELRGLTVVVCGDLKNGRTIHSLVYALARFGANVVTLAAAGMELPQYVVERMEEEYGYSLTPVVANDLRAVVTETDALYLTPKQPHQLALYTELDRSIQLRLSTMASQLRYDAFYMTRKQKERIKEGAGAGSYPIIGDDFLKAKLFKDTVVMHPLPRIDELSPELDRDKRGIYFKQAAYGVPVRMALLRFLFDRAGSRAGTRAQARPVYQSPVGLGPHCGNANCVAVTETGSTRRRYEILSGGPGGALILTCVYCDHRFKIQLVGDVQTKRYCAYDISLRATIGDWLEKHRLAIFNSIKEAEEAGYEPYQIKNRRVVMKPDEIGAAVKALSGDILNECRDSDRLLLVGIRTQGSVLARRIAAELQKRNERKYEVGEIDVYGADEEIRRISPPDMDSGPLQLRDREIVLVDDVIYTGRTIKDALSIIFRSGRPKMVRLAVLIDRGHREVPVKPNFVGKHIPSSERERVRVKLAGEQAEKDEAVIYSIEHPGAPEKESARAETAEGNRIQ
jgi:aspartate carbamoyltransferase catalytic subunit